VAPALSLSGLPAANPMVEWTRHKGDLSRTAGRRLESYRIGADIGGTFTDLVMTGPSGRTWTRKVLSSPDDYSLAVVQAVREMLREAGAPGSAVAEVVHGTTVATNTILENKGAKTALITTKGFRDVLELRRLRVPELFSLFYTPPKPLAERRLRLEVDERLDADGTVVRHLNEASVREAIKRVRASGAEAVAVCLLHSYRNPAHERRIGELVRAAMPNIFLSLSIDILPEIREYERTSTTVVNSYIGPVVGKYLQSLEGGLREAGVAGGLRIMQSNGGVMSASSAAAMPAYIVESGPAAGVVGAHRAALAAGLRNIISFDMGGTTAKASLIEGGQRSWTTEYEVGAGIQLSSRLVKGRGHAVKLPVLDIAEVGAGGGSTVRVDSGGALKVGPQSAGAVPGPACYGAGGVEATVTDANVVLGYVSPDALAGGAVAVRPDLAREAIQETAAKPLSLGLLDAALGVHSVANANMVRALKAVSTYRGRDPRDFTLFAFGGNGPVHACGLAQLLGISQVVVPPAPGLFSATGMLQAAPERHFVQTRFGRMSEVTDAELRTAFDELQRRASKEMSGEGDPASTVTWQRRADLRYAGQAFELSVDVRVNASGAGVGKALVEGFHREHLRTYGHNAPGEEVEVVSVRLVARTRAPKSVPMWSPQSGARSKAARGVRAAYFGSATGLIDTPVLSRSALDERPAPGPLIVEEYDATTVVPPGCSARLDVAGNILINVLARGAKRRPARSAPPGRAGKGR